VRSVTLDAVEGLQPPAQRGRRGPVVIVLAVALVLAACVGESEATTSPSKRATPPKATASLMTGPAQPSEAPADSAEPSFDPDASPAESPLVTPGPAAACAGTDANRAFYVTVADHVTWDVYCPVLPKGWIVDAGTYRTSSGGWLKIVYKASGGRRFELREGAFCSDPATCAPTGVEIASGPFGDREATAVAVEDGGFAMSVDSGQKISWVAIGKGIDEQTFRAHAEALFRIGD
jgi:hypothetical protein